MYRDVYCTSSVCPIWKCCSAGSVGCASFHVSTGKKKRILAVQVSQQLKNLHLLLQADFFFRCYGTKIYSIVCSQSYRLLFWVNIFYPKFRFLYTIHDLLRALGHILYFNAIAFRSSCCKKSGVGISGAKKSHNATRTAMCYVAHGCDVMTL